ncbi:MAG: hypothetical protein AMJ90_04115 [candidate division Zixibacteria bacterium SM23_73_2]|nr:MAG: hypothetical protein AMJ90_04115 [candidate division Zixibacteria bacterium SM23_73_2]
MALRLIEAVLPKQYEHKVQEILKDHKVLGIWQQGLSEEKVLVRVLLPTVETEAILDLLKKHYSHLDGFRVMLLSVEASLPRPDEPEKKTEKEKPKEKPTPQAKVNRKSRQEIYTDINQSSKLSTVYLVMVILSTIVAALGILLNNIFAIIGAMVIAPLLGPNVALSLATTLGDIDLAKRALKANLSGIFTALFISIIIGTIFTVSPDIHVLAFRTKTGLGDVVLALASGSAGALAFTTGISTALVGVMVAVALLPPLVTFGLLLGSGHFQMALGAMLLLLINLICINLAGVTTFLAQGIRPITWWEADRAKKATRDAIIIWGVLLLALIIVILLTQRG